ncbi:element excision factor XisI family protein [Roseofilum sp. Belize BBD 4]|nr:XisI protein [Roseofilum sp. Belize Diploria]MBP0032359.1 XisI protein [Roseofilum sp. Belize BBD 4]
MLNPIVTRGIPKEDIVLAFHSPKTGKFSELAIA